MRGLQRVVLPILGAAMVAIAWRSWGWQGALFAAGAIVMWMLLHFHRMMKVLRKAADRPKGFVSSAVMLNARLKPRVTLLHVMSMTESLGEPVSAPGEQPEVFRWTDASDSHVTCEFVGGKLAKWTLERPAEP